MSAQNTLWVFEDNNGTLELARTPKFRPRMKHILLNTGVDYVKKHKNEILPVNTKDQLAEIFTKPLPKEMFGRVQD